jgi:hypothetical protein
MNMTCEIRQPAAPGGAVENHYDRVMAAVAELKVRLQARYGRTFPGQDELVHDVIAAAEAVAWHTEFPHLFLPDLVEVRIVELSAHLDSAFPEIETALVRAA